MLESERLSGCSDWIESDFVERERTPEPVIEIGIQINFGG